RDCALGFCFVLWSANVRRRHLRLPAFSRPVALGARPNHAARSECERKGVKVREAVSFLPAGRGQAISLAIYFTRERFPGFRRNQGPSAANAWGRAFGRIRGQQSRRGVAETPRFFGRRVEPQ